MKIKMREMPYEEVLELPRLKNKKPFKPSRFLATIVQILSAPKGLGALMKRLGVPVVTVITQGAFHRDPLYNMLQIRDVKVSAHVKCIATPDEIKEKLEDGTYLLDTEVDIAIQVNLDSVCNIGKGRLVHNLDGFRLTGADGKLDYKQSPVFTHTLYSDYYWYEIGDVIGIGDNEFSYFCFPKENVSVTKARLATEELYKKKKIRRQKVGI